MVVFPKRMLGRMRKRSERVLGRMSKRQEEETSRMLTRMSKRNEETTRILGRMTKRGRFSNMRWRPEDDAEQGSRRERRVWIGPSGMIHLGKHWLNLAFNRGDKELPPNAWGRVSKRTTNDDGRRFSRIGMVKREAEDDKEGFDMAKRSGPGGRFIRIGMVGEGDAGEEFRVAKRSYETNDQSSRWIRIGLTDRMNHGHFDWERISKKSVGRDWNPDKPDQSSPLDSDLPTESLDGDDAWDEAFENGEEGRPVSSLGEEEGE